MAISADRVLAAAVGVVVVAAGIAAVAAVNRGPAELDPATPAGVVQTYLTAIADGDPDAAVEQLATDSPCTASDLEMSYYATEFRAALVGDPDESGDRAVVLVDITEGDGGGAFGEGWSHEERFVVVREGTTWRLSGSPWPMYSCLEQG